MYQPFTQKETNIYHTKKWCLYLGEFMGLLYLENVYVCKSLYDRWYIFYLQPSECPLFFFIFSNIKEAMFPHLGFKIM